MRQVLQIQNSYLGLDYAKGIHLSMAEVLMVLFVRHGKLVECP